MWTYQINGVDFYHIINWLIIYSFFGWVWETSYVSIKEGEYVNRGFVNGPFCTIYGCGAVSVYLILKPLGDYTLLLYLGGVVVATALEYMTAVLMESIFHTSWWDYSDKKFNFQGRICLEASLGWGFFTVILFRVLQPLVDDIVALYSMRMGEIAACVILAVYLCDFTYSAAEAFHLHDRIPAWEQALAQKEGELLVALNRKMDSWEQNRGVSLANRKFRMEDVEFLRAFEEKRRVLREELAQELKNYRHSLAKGSGHNVRRFIKSYPNLNRGYRIRHRADR